MRSFSDFRTKKISGQMTTEFFFIKRKRFCLTHKKLKKFFSASENCPDFYLDLRKARFGFTTSKKRGGSLEGR